MKSNEAAPPTNGWSVRFCHVSEQTDFSELMQCIEQDHAYFNVGSLCGFWGRRIPPSVPLLVESNLRWDAYTQEEVIGREMESEFAQWLSCMGRPEVDAVLLTPWKQADERIIRAAKASLESLRAEGVVRWIGQWQEETFHTVDRFFDFVATHDSKIAKALADQATPTLFCCEIGSDDFAGKTWSIARQFCLHRPEDAQAVVSWAKAQSVDATECTSHA